MIFLINSLSLLSKSVIFCESLFIFLFFVIEEVILLSNIFGGSFLIYFSDLVVRDIVIFLFLCIMLVFIFDMSKTNGLVFLIEYFVLIFILLISLY